MASVAFALCEALERVWARLIRLKRALPFVKRPFSLQYLRYSLLVFAFILIEIFPDGVF